MKIEDIIKVNHLKENDQEFLNFCHFISKEQVLPDNWADFKYYDHIYLNTTNIFHVLSLCANLEVWKTIYPFLEKKLGTDKIHEFLLMKQLRSYHGTPLDKLAQQESIEVAEFLLNKLSKNIVLTKFWHGETDPRDETKQNFSIKPTEVTFWDIYCVMALKSPDPRKYLETGFKKGLKFEDIFNHDYDRVNLKMVKISQEDHFLNQAIKDEEKEYKQRVVNKL